MVIIAFFKDFKVFKGFKVIRDLLFSIFNF